MLKLYTDGVGIQRCTECHAPIRSVTDGVAMSAIRHDELEHVILALADMARQLETITRIFEHHAGRNVEQLRRVAASMAEPIPADAKTDRAGLRTDGTD